MNHPLLSNAVVEAVRTELIVEMTALEIGQMLHAALKALTDAGYVVVPSLKLQYLEASSTTHQKLRGDVNIALNLLTSVEQSLWQAKAMLTAVGGA